jgi:peptide methionine sulfoxide reductase MsrA
LLCCTAGGTFDHGDLPQSINNKRKKNKKQIQQQGEEQRQQVEKPPSIITNQTELETFSTSATEHQQEQVESTSPTSLPSQTSPEVSKATCNLIGWLTL